MSRVDINCINVQSIRHCKYSHNNLNPNTHNSMKVETLRRQRKFQDKPRTQENISRGDKLDTIVTSISHADIKGAI